MVEGWVVLYPRVRLPLESLLLPLQLMWQRDKPKRSSPRAPADAGTLLYRGVFTRKGSARANLCARCKTVVFSYAEDQVSR